MAKQGIEGKYLLEWLEGMSRQKLFFLAWGIVAFFFLIVFLRQFSKMDQRQFRQGKGRQVPPTAKGSGGKELVLKEPGKVEVRKGT